MDHIVVEDGRLMPVFDLSESIFEKVYVETPLDTDHDGKRDLIMTYVCRPKETLSGMKVPVIYIADPYIMGNDDDRYILHDVDADLPEYAPREVTEEEITYIPEKRELPPERVPRGEAQTAPYPKDADLLDCIDSWYEYFVCRGYAAVFAGGIGTEGSQGLRSCGGEDETISTIAVIEWLNGKRRAYTNATDCIEIKAGWCTGAVAMTGKSYLGTLCVAAAVSGVEGLKTIIPEAFIADWYDYFRMNGTTAPALAWQGDDADSLADYCLTRRFDAADFTGIEKLWDEKYAAILAGEDRESANYNLFWDERNYLKRIGDMRCSALCVQGLNDWNVKPTHAYRLWQAMKEQGIECRMYLHQGDHMYINNLEGCSLVDTVNLWLAHYLYGIDNHAPELIPPVQIESNLDPSVWDCFDSWPASAVRERTFAVDAQGTLQTVDEPESGISGAGISEPLSDPSKEPSSRRKSFCDDLAAAGFDRKAENYDDWRDAIVSEPEQERTFRLAFAGEPLSGPLRLNGEAKISFTASIDAGAGILSAMLVDYGTACRYTVKTYNVEEQSVNWGLNTDKKDLIAFERETEPTDYKVVTRGCMSAKNRSGPASYDEVIPGKDYEFSFTMVPMDYTFDTRHRIGLVIYGTDAELTQRPLKVRTITVDEGSISLKLPLL